MNIKVFPFISIFILGAILFAATSPHALASPFPLQTAVGHAPTQVVGSINPQELESFLDDLLASEMADKHTPGVVVAVVQDGSLLLAKGYGYAELDQLIPVDPERTLFRVGSISKLFTWTAVMQLLERGKLSLDTDVNEYLDFAIPATFPEPITLRHLMSHTPGFEFKGTNLWGLQPERMIPLGDWLKDNQPARVFPPGEVASYSNYGTALAGYIVERLSGLPFNDYVERNIFAPLGMEHSTFRQPVPENLSADVATGYNYTSEYIAGGFLYQLPFPVGALSATATDMARFMIAHLQNGELEGQRILQEQTALQMHSQLYTPDPRLENMAHGFFESTLNGQRIISHGGAASLFHSDLWLIPGQNVGLFISTNGIRGYLIKESVKKAFLDHYYPVLETSPLQSSAGFAERIAPYLGEYTQAQSNFTTYEKIYGIFSPIRASLESDNTLVVSQPGREFRFVEVEPGLLQDISDPDNQWVYRTNPDGRHFLIPSEPYPFFRTPWYGSGMLHMVLFIGGTLLFLVALIAWPIGSFRRRKQAPASSPDLLPARLARWAAALFGILWVAVSLGIMSIFIDIIPAFSAPRIIFENLAMMDFLLSLSYVLGGLALAILIFAILAWVKHYWSLGARIFYSLLALLALLLIWWLSYWNLFL